MLYECGLPAMKASWGSAREGAQFDDIWFALPWLNRWLIMAASVQSSLTALAVFVSLEFDTGSAEGIYPFWRGRITAEHMAQVSPRAEEVCWFFPTAGSKHTPDSTDECLESGQEWCVTHITQSEVWFTHSVGCVVLHVV